MKILYCIPMLYNSGGMERVLTQKVNWLAAHTEHEITILTTECTPEGRTDIYFPLDNRVRVEALHIDFNDDYAKPLCRKWIGHVRRMRTYRRALYNYICANETDLCISLGGKEIAFLHTLPCRTIVEMHFAKEQRSQLLMANHHGRMWSLLGRVRTGQLVRAVKPLERLVVLTRKDMQDWQEAGCTNVICIPNPCSLDEQEQPIPTEKKKVVLAVGRLHEQKGFDLLLQAWEHVEKSYPEWTLRIVGEGPKRSELEKQIKELGLERAELAGSMSNVANEYAEASLFVLSSRYEGFSLVLSEAMWSGLPCVAFDCPQGPAELLGNNRGWLVSNGDITALAKQIAYAIGHPEEAAQKAAQAKAYAQQTYSEAAIMPRWIEIIENRI